MHWKVKTKEWREGDVLHRTRHQFILYKRIGDDCYLLEWKEWEEIAIETRSIDLLDWKATKWLN